MRLGLAAIRRRAGGGGRPRRRLAILASSSPHRRDRRSQRPAPAPPLGSAGPAACFRRASVAHQEASSVASDPPRSAPPVAAPGASAAAACDDETRCGAAAALHPPLPSQSSPPPFPRPCTPEPVLLLEGDVLCVTDGVSRTLYQMSSPPSPTFRARRADSRPTVHPHRPRTGSALAIEEAHELETGRKRYTLRYEAGSHPTGRGGADASGGDDEDDRAGEVPSPMGPSVSRIELQEITHPPRWVDNVSSARENSQLSPSSPASLLAVTTDVTGGMTWESAMVMAMHFADHPEELSGHVVELGSGLGLGGILLLDGFRQRSFRRRGPSASSCSPGRFQSLTMTDGNDRVVEQCRDNVAHAASGMLGLDATVQVAVKKLDWNSVCSKTGNRQQPRRGTYDTVLASDCVYRRDDVAVLAGTMVALLKPHGAAKIHCFSPLNRSALPDFVEALKSLGMHVVQETVELRRSRLRGPTTRMVMDGWSSFLSGPPSLEAPQFASETVSTFSHVTATYLSKPSCSWQEID